MDAHTAIVPGSSLVSVDAKGEEEVWYVVVRLVGT